MAISVARVNAYRAEVHRLWTLTDWSAAPELLGDRTYPGPTSTDLADVIARLPATAADDAELADSFRRVLAYVPPTWTTAERDAALATLRAILRG